MHLAALIDLGVPEHYLRDELARLSVAGEFELKLARGEKMGISGTHAKVYAEDQHDHRHHSTIVNMIKDAKFETAIEQRALDIFEAIAIAEGKIHNIPPQDVHFHEVGAIDSIVDIVAAAICIDYFDPEVILCNPIEVGSGFVDCAHGRFPVPAPATQELLANAPCTYGGVQGESTTPTGAAIMCASVDEYQPQGIFTPQKIGYGVGFKDFEIPNVLRVALGEYATVQSSDETVEHFKIEANIDDMTPEAYEPLMQVLFDAGAVDVYLTPIVMKKGRPAHCISALCESASVSAVSDALLNQSTTIGLRVIAFDKRVLAREMVKVETRYGAVEVKRVTQPDGRTRWKSEHDDVLRIARERGQDYPRVKAALDTDIANVLSDDD
jgi:uncharacterized protein (TIGR00299 family) protein